MFENRTQAFIREYLKKLNQKENIEITSCYSPMRS